ncbi:MAG TPA: hypothetical protein VG755_19580 [Nannocystaceae bacterium]|nr:hypothetical protein [Nannocystaceae bacterium]
MSHRLRRLVRRRAPDLAVAALIVGWMIACKGKKPATPTTQPASALAESPKATTPPTTTAATPEPTSATVAGLEWVAARGECKVYPDFGDKLALARAGSFDQLDAAIAEGALGRDPTAQWLVLAHDYLGACVGEAAPEQRELRAHLDGFAPLPETLVDQALDQRRCGLLGAIDEVEMWPYELQFARELQERDFSGAEVTRVLWRDTMSSWLEVCGDGVSRRQRVGAQTRVTKLDRIIGLDDHVLIELRSKMLTALEAGESARILDYSRAISEREKALDSRNAEVYEQKLRDIEAAVAMQEKELAAVRSASASTPTTPTTPAKPDNTADLARKTANVAQSAKNVHDTVKTAKSIGKMFGL